MEPMRGVREQRAVRIQAAKVNSVRAKTRLAYGDEHFLFEDGKLVEYEHALPKDYFPEGAR